MSGAPESVKEKTYQHTATRKNEYTAYYRCYQGFPLPDPLVLKVRYCHHLEHHLQEYGDEMQACLLSTRSGGLRHKRDPEQYGQICWLDLGWMEVFIRSQL